MKNVVDFGPPENFNSEFDNSSSINDFKHSRLSDNNPSQESRDSDKEKCVFCPKLKNFKETFLMLNKALYLKYSSSQNYYYSKDINDLVENEKKPHVILFKYRVNFEDEEENLTRFYNSSEFDYKLNYLTEYYKYHREVPRLFMLPVSNTMNNYHDRKRRIEYFKIKKMLNEQNKGIITNNDKNEPESTEEKKSSIYSEDSEKNSEFDNNKNKLQSSKILALLDISSKNDTQMKMFENSYPEKYKNDLGKFFHKKMENKPENQEIDSITLEELNFYLTKVPSPDENRPSLNNQGKQSPFQFDNGNALLDNLNEINFDFSELRQSSNKVEEQYSKPKKSLNEEKPEKQLQLNPESIIPESTNSNNQMCFFNKSELVRSCKVSSSVQTHEKSLEDKKPPNNLQKALKQLNNNPNTGGSTNNDSGHPINKSNSNSINRHTVSQIFSFRDLSKNLQIFNKLIERQKSQITREKSAGTKTTTTKSSKSHRNVNSIDLNNLKSLNFKTSVAVTPKNREPKPKTSTSLSNFQHLLHSNKEKLTEFINSKLNMQGIKELKSDKKTKNSSSNSIKKTLTSTNMNHRRIQSSENGKNQCNSAKSYPSNLLHNNFFKSAVQQKKNPNADLFHERMFSPKQIMTTVSEYSPNKHLKHFNPVSPSTIIATSNVLFSAKERMNTEIPKKPQPVGFRKLNLDDRVYVKNNRAKPKSFQIHMKTENEQDIFNDYKIKEQGTSKNTSMNSKASITKTENPRKEQLLNAENTTFKKLQKGSSSSASLKVRKQNENDNKNQQMKINIISNFFNFNNGSEHEKETNPILLKLKNEFCSLKASPNYKFLDINLVSKFNDRESIQKKNKKN